MNLCQFCRQGQHWLCRRGPRCECDCPDEWERVDLDGNVYYPPLKGGQIDPPEPVRIYPTEADYE